MRQTKWCLWLGSVRALFVLISFYSYKTKHKRTPTGRAHTDYKVVETVSHAMRCNGLG